MTLTLQEIIKINDILISQLSIPQDEFENYLDIIGEYIDKTFFEQDAIIEKLVEFSEKSGRKLDVKFWNKSLIVLSDEHIRDYLINCKSALEQALFKNKETFKYYIFTEIKSIVRFYLNKSYTYPALFNYETLYDIKSAEFHQQNESFKYLFTVFDKITYIARHLHDKYVKKEKTDLNEVSLKFYADFPINIKFLAKDDKMFLILQTSIEKITTSRAWHYIRKLRNNIEHDFSNPSSRYNITFSLQLLFIIIGRIMLILRKTLKSDLEMHYFFKSVM